MDDNRLLIVGTVDKLSDFTTDGNRIRHGVIRPAIVKKMDKFVFLAAKLDGELGSVHFPHALGVLLLVRHHNFDRSISGSLLTSSGHVVRALFFASFLVVAELKDHLDFLLQTHEPELGYGVFEWTLGTNVAETVTDVDKTGMDVVI